MDVIDEKVLNRTSFLPVYGLKEMSSFWEFSLVFKPTHFDS